MEERINSGDDRRKIRGIHFDLKRRFEADEFNREPVIESEVPNIGGDTRSKIMWEIFATVPELMAEASEEEDGVFYPNINISFMAEDTWRFLRKDNGKPGKFSKTVRKWFNKAYEGMDGEKDAAMIGSALVLRAFRLETLSMPELLNPESDVSLQLVDRLQQIPKKVIREVLDDFEAKNGIYDSVMDRANKGSVIPREQMALTEIIHVSAGESEYPKALIHGAEAMFYLLGSVWPGIYPELSKPIKPPTIE
ncbi:MAG TPA: hypothetical protein VHE53_01695 [Patescibacteria group bacterium]|nr:hypothetical protein [Patescibacteria group bacterium]